MVVYLHMLECACTHAHICSAAFPMQAFEFYVSVRGNARHIV